MVVHLLLLKGSMVKVYILALGSAKLAIKVLMESGVEPKNIMFLNLICAPEGIEALTAEYPEVQVVYLLCQARTIYP